MSLIDRLSGIEEPKLPVHQFWGGLVEWLDGEVTRQDIIDAFSISLAEETELDWLKGKLNASTNKSNFMHHIHSLFMLAESSLFNYQTKSVMQARISGLP